MMQNKLAAHPLVSLLFKPLKTVKPVAAAVQQGATKATARAAGVQPEALAANPIKNTYRAATLAGMPTYRRVTQGAGLAATGTTGAIAVNEANNAYQEKIVQPYNAAVSPLVSQGLLSPEQSQKGLAAIRQGMWNQAPNMLPWTGNDATAAQRGAIYGELFKQKPAIKPSIVGGAAAVASNLSPVGIAKNVGTAALTASLKPTPEQARQATLAAINPRAEYADGSSALTSGFAVTAKRDAIAAANRIIPNNPQAAAILAAAMAGTTAGDAARSADPSAESPAPAATPPSAPSSSPSAPPSTPPSTIPSTSPAIPEPAPPAPPEIPSPPPSAPPSAPSRMNYNNLGIGTGVGAAGGLAAYEMLRSKKKKHAAERLLALLGGGALGGVASLYGPKAS